MNTKLFSIALAFAVSVGAVLALSSAPVHANAPPGRYQVGSLSVVDTSTGLTWQRGSGGEMAYADAVTYCAALSIDGETWRLPTVRELLSLVDPTRFDPAIDTTAFPMTVSTGYRTASPYVDDPSLGWYVTFVDGASSVIQLNVTAVRVRCVR